MEQTQKIIIAIDGYSSTGKSTLAKSLAKKLGYIYVDTGSMYRAVTWYAMKKGLIDKNHFDQKALVADLDKVDLEFKYNSDLGYSEIYLNGEKAEGAIRSMELSNLVSQVAEVSEVRHKLVEIQQNMGIYKGIVMDGRDIGTVVFPESELKIFLTASPDTRAKRRYNEMLDDGKKITYQSVLENVSNRDRIDTTRKDSPLVKAADAIEIDNSHMDVKETFDEAYGLVAKVLNMID